MSEVNVIGGDGRRGPLYLDARPLAKHSFGSRDLMWWGTAGFMLIEGVVFAMVIATWAYLRGVEPEWPPPGYRPPDLLWGTVNTGILLASLVPTWLLARAVHRLDLRATRLWMVIADLFGIAFLIGRGLEFTALGVRWDSNAYGSIQWVLLAFHTTHLLTDAIESWVLTVLLWTDPGERRMVDVSEDAIYWNYVVATWIPIYLVIYWGPRWL